MQKQLVIHPLVGLGEIKFGMSSQQVAEIMNEKEVYEDWMGGNLNFALLFHGLIFGFDKCNAYGLLKDSKLVEIFVYGREDVILFEKPLDSWSLQELIDYAAEENLKLLHYGKSAINYTKLGVDIYFHEGKARLQFFQLVER